MMKMARRLLCWERKRLQKRTEDARRRGGVSASLFLEGEMNALSDADCFFFYGSRRNPKALLTVFFPDEEHGEITAAEFEETEQGLSALFCSALRECKRVKVEQLHTVRNPKGNFSFAKIKNVKFTYEWSEYMLCCGMKELTRIGENQESGEITVRKELSPESDGTICYRLLLKDAETAKCHILPVEGGTQCYLFGLKTKEEFRKQGMATRLIKEIATEYAGIDGAVMRLQVSSKNKPAENLYRKLGFWTEEEREYYKTEEC